MKSMLRTRLFVLLILAVAGSVVADRAYAGPDPDFEFAFSSEETFIGLETVLTLSFTIADAPLAGWSIGACHDDLVSLAAGDVVNGSVTATVNNGFPPGFHAVNVLAAGFTIGSIVNLFGLAELAPGDDLEMYLVTYTALAEGEAVVEFCSTGTPIVDNSVVVGVEAFTPVQVSGTISISAEIPVFIFTIPDTAVEYRPEDGLAVVTVSPTIVENPAGLPDTYPNPTVGFSMGIDHDETYLTPTSLVPAGPVADLNGGAGPEFFGVNLAASGTGVTVGVVYVFFDDDTITFDLTQPVITITYEGVLAALIDNEVGVNSPLVFSDSLGVPPVRNTAVINGFSQDVILEDGTVQLIPILIAPFVRGECTDDGALNIADGITILNILFLDFPVPVCPAACDANGSRTLELADAIFFFNFLFIGGPSPPPPYPDCGPTDNPDEVCEVFESCD